MARTYRINQELKYPYLKKQKLNEQLYQLHLQCAYQWSYTWSYIQHTCIVNSQLLIMTEKLQQTLNKKLNNLRSSACKDTRHQLRQNKDKNQPSQFQFYSKFQESDGYLSFPRRKRNTGIRNLTFMGPCIVNEFFKYNQQDATLYNILYYCPYSTCFRRFLRPSSGAQKLYTQHRVYVELACCYR
jgi:hypothetical protein